MANNPTPLSLQTLEDLLRSPPSYPDGLVGRNVSLAGSDSRNNDSFPMGGGGGYEGGGAAANSTQTSDAAAELLGLNHTNDDIIKELVNTFGSRELPPDVESKSANHNHQSLS